MRGKFGSSGMKGKHGIAKCLGKYEDHFSIFYLKYIHIWLLRVKFITVVGFSMYVDVKYMTTAVT